MATPNYKGPNQPQPSSGGWFGSLFGGTPAYKTLDQRSASYSTAGPAYKAAPSDSVTSSEQSEACAQGPFAIVIPREVIDQ